MPLPSRLESGDAPQRGEEFAPGTALFGEDLPAGGGEPVVPSTTLTRSFNPPSVDPSTAFHSIQHRIQRRHVKPQYAARSVVNHTPRTDSLSEAKSTACGTRVALGKLESEALDRFGQRLTHPPL